jgi:insulin receptor
VGTTTETGDHDIDNHLIDEFSEHTTTSSHNQAIGIAPGENHSNMYDGNNRLITFYQKVTGTSYTVVGVRHYAEYAIQVMACHDHDPVRNRTLCSPTAAMTSTRTKKSGMFYFAHNYRELLVILAFLFETDFEDDIVGGIVRYESNYTSPSIKIGWNEPEDPNGLVIKYLLEYRRSDNASLIIF